ncbi:hypothetical protein GCM10012276_18650 [Nocardioides deserti]|nr:hypothetical protein GCM10012276_18650 [Nocardioides deserti]
MKMRALTPFALVSVLAVPSVVGLSVQGPASSAPKAAAAGCQWQVIEHADGSVSVARGNGKATRLEQKSTDRARPTFVGEADTQPVSVTLWKGTPRAEVDAVVEAGAAQQDELLAASLAGAKEGATDHRASQTFTTDDNVPVGPLETVAYRVEVGESVETGTPERASQVKMNRGRVAKDCVRTASGAPRGATTIDSATGRVVIASVDDNDGENGLVAKPTYPSTTTVVRYRTFIPAAKTPPTPCGTFSGDNRTFSSHYDRRNRTRASIFFNWPTRTMDATRRVGATKKLNSSGAVIESKTASVAGINIHTPTMGGTFGRVSITHSVGNPLCSVAGAIAYNVVVEAWSDGSARIAGTRVEVPNHEAYVYPTSGTYGKTIFTRSSNSFICLSVNCGQESLWETYP